MEMVWLNIKLFGSYFILLLIFLGLAYLCVGIAWSYIVRKRLEDKERLKRKLMVSSVMDEGQRSKLRRSIF